MLENCRNNKKLKVPQNNNEINKKEYRPEIDGLRAVAVIAVILNHFNKDLLMSGYLGVDIFFVISGFVITSSIDKRKHLPFLPFIKDFYERRIKRILPALLFFVIAISFAICLIIKSPEYYLTVGGRSLIGISNITFYRNSIDYFADSSDLNPFLHTWSLSVEEQFYLIFPFIIWFSGFTKKTKNGLKKFFFIITFISFISLINYLYFYNVNFSATYFLMPLRFWELGFGCISYLIKKNYLINKVIQKKYFK